LLVPYPHAADDHQTANARAFTAGGAGWLVPQASLDPAMLSGLLAERLTDAAGLARAAAQARACARDDAAERLADLVLALAPATAAERAA
jgi:UDP-N-acetylglucosamine--N-acetylmuramyl-(pentapeptide) pyrophosphoryl-undecaprenol N-acetylglucosamine transferase